MSEKQMQNEKLYLATMSMAKKLLNDGVISDDEYEKIDTSFIEKYSISLSTLFTDISLIKFEKYGNMYHKEGFDG